MGTICIVLTAVVVGCIGLTLISNTTLKIVKKIRKYKEEESRKIK